MIAFAVILFIDTTYLFVDDFVNVKRFGAGLNVTK